VTGVNTAAKDAANTSARSAAVARIIATLPTWTFLSLYSGGFRKANRSYVNKLDAGLEVPALLLSRADEAIK
jgi:hypothetical protein